MIHGFIIICQKANGDQCSGSTCLHQALRNSSAGRGMVCVFWDRQGVVLVNFMSQNIMWMQAYSTLLSHQLQPVICKKWRGLLKKGVILQHVNDFHHSAHLSDSREKWRDGLRIVATSAIQSRIRSKWFSFAWTTQGIVWRHYLTTIEKKMFNNTSRSFYMMPSKISMLRASAD